ncbi:MAG: efflux RND transporter periplasmic adaptor subunit [Anaerolineae bacterium]|nr:MAG: efflux RND transporter periplasmic adaptor subunit [Anaerolineae bacterium]
MQRATARQALEEARQALEDARQSDMQRAQAQLAVAQAQQELEDAERQLALLTATPSRQAIEQVHSNILLTQDAISQMEKDLQELEKQLNRKFYLPFESREGYQQAYNALQLQLAQARKRLEVLQSRYDDLLAPPDPVDLAEARARLATARARLKDAQREWERVKDGPSEAEIAVLQARLDDARREWERVKDGPAPEDVLAAEARVAAAQARLDTARLIAPFSGVVTRLKIQPGDQVQPGQVALRLDDLSALSFQAAVSEIDLPQIEVGQPADVLLDGAPGRAYAGEVTAVSPVGTIAGGVVTFDVTVQILEVDSFVRPGMTGTVRIHVGRVDNALLVPNAALRVQDGQRVVYVLEERPLSGLRAGLRRLFGGEPTRVQLRPVPLQIGLQSHTQSQVLEGDLQAGDKVVLNPPQVLLNMPGLVISSP